MEDADLSRPEAAVRERPGRRIALDLRSLALFRIALGAVLLGDLITRAFDLTVFYTDFGVLPRAALLDKFVPAQRFSVHLMSGQFVFQAALFLIAGVFAVMLSFGIRTRLATFASWFMLVSNAFRRRLCRLASLRAWTASGL